jgi:hypothetical protein
MMGHDLSGRRNGAQRHGTSDESDLRAHSDHVAQIAQLADYRHIEQPGQRANDPSLTTD